MARGAPHPGAWYLLLSALPWASVEPEHPAAFHLCVGIRPGVGRYCCFKRKGKAVLAGQSEEAPLFRVLNIGLELWFFKNEKYHPLLPEEP